MLTARPKIAELVFQLYGRPLHPELFQFYGTRTSNAAIIRRKSRSPAPVTWSRGVTAA